MYVSYFIILNQLDMLPIQLLATKFKHENEQVIASENQPVQWTTPLGLHVVQPYRQLGRHLVIFGELLRTSIAAKISHIRCARIFKPNRW